VSYSIRESYSSLLFSVIVSHSGVIQSFRHDFKFETNRVVCASLCPPLLVQESFAGGLESFDIQQNPPLQKAGPIGVTRLILFASVNDR